MEPFYTHFRLLINTHDIILSPTTQAQNGAISAHLPKPSLFQLSWTGQSQDHGSGPS